MIDKLAGALDAEEYEYAGFRYTMVPMYGSWSVIPHDGQHPAANKDRHKRNALEMFLTERKGPQS